MSSIADLIAAQKEIMENMNKLYMNFKKEGKERKTSDSIKRRLQSLEAFWREFSQNHEKLVNICDETEDDMYFEDDSYFKTKKFYDDVRVHLLKSYDEVTNRSQSPSGPKTSETQKPSTPTAQPSTSTAGTSTSETMPKKVLPLPRFVFHDVDKPSKIDEMMRKQQSNFKALARTISQINLNVLSEKWEFQDVLKIIESRWAAIDSLHWEIDSNLEFEDKTYDELFNRYENEYYDIKKSINNRMWDTNHREKSTPHIDIPIFSGNYQQWISFKDLFLEAIHKNKSMSRAQKMQFLKSKLRGEAEKLIQHLHISSENYQTCWDILNQRYNNKKLIFNSHMNTLMSLPIIHQQTAFNIKRLHDTTNECLNAIKNLGVDITTWDPMIVYCMAQKLDAETYNDYIDSLPEPRDLPYLKDFLSFLEGKFIALESARRKSETNKYSQPTSNEKHQYNQNNYTNNNQYRTPKEGIYRHPNAWRQIDNKPFINHSTTNTSQKCFICNEDHVLYMCTKFRELTNQEKRKAISQLNICKNCLINHNGRDCNSQKTCRICNEKHNTLLHNAYTYNRPVANPSFNNQRHQPNYVSSKPDILNIEIPSINNIVNVTMNITPLTSTNQETDIDKELEIIGKKIEQIKNNTKEDLDDTSFDNHDLHHYIVIYILTGAGLVTAVAYGVRRIRARARWPAAEQAPPQPQPRARAAALHRSASASDQCDSASVQCTSASDHVYAKVKKVKLPNSFNFSVVE